MWIKSEDGVLLNLDFVREITLKEDSDPRGGTAWRVSVTGDGGTRMIQAFPYTDKPTGEAAHRRAETLFQAIESSLSGSGALIDLGAIRAAKTTIR